MAFNQQQQGPFWDFVQSMNGAGVDHQANANPNPFAFFGPPPPPGHGGPFGGPGPFGHRHFGGRGGGGRRGRCNRRNGSHERTPSQEGPSDNEPTEGEGRERSGHHGGRHGRHGRRGGWGGPRDAEHEHSEGEAREGSPRAHGHGGPHGGRHGGHGRRGGWGGPRDADHEHTDGEARDFSPHGHHGPHGPHGFGFDGPHGHHGRRGGWGGRGRGGFGGFPGAHGGGFDLSALLQSLSAHPLAQAFSNYTQQATGEAQRSGETLVPENDDASFTPPVDVFSTPAAYILHVALPGAKKEDVGVNWDAEKSVLNIAGVVYRPGDEEFLKSLSQSERKVGVFERAITLPPAGSGEKEEVDGDAITAKLEDGVLIVTVAKVEKEWTEVKRVDIN